MKFLIKFKKAFQVSVDFHLQYVKTIINNKFMLIRTNNIFVSIYQRHKQNLLRMIPYKYKKRINCDTNSFIF